MSDDQPDVGITSLGDRRRIKELEVQVAHLEGRVAELGSVSPGLTHSRGDCMHGGTFEVSDSLPEVTCNVCGKIMDPWSVLRRIAHREVNFCYTLRSLRAEAEQLRADIPKLKAKRSTLARKVRRDKDTPVALLGDTIRRHDAKAFVVQWHSGAWKAAFRMSYGMVTIDGGDSVQGVLERGGSPEDAIASAIAALERRKAAP